MIAVVGDLWTYPAEWRGVTTNGLTNSQGHAIMGAGTALQAKARFPDLPAKLGRDLRVVGNHVRLWYEYGVFTFPTKHDWRQRSTKRLIFESAVELRYAMLGYLGPIVLPRPGCSNGGLDWELDVYPVIYDVLRDDKFHIINTQPEPERVHQ